MSKWNKPAKPLSEEFLQNQERRRQMIIEASKKRREKQKKLQQINQNLKRNEEQALEKHKREKQEAYNKYLKNNMHDKYQQIKKQQKSKQQPKKDVSKWKRKQKQQTKTIEALDLEKSHGKVYASQSAQKPKKQQAIKKGVQTKKKVADEFQKQWAEQQQQQKQQIKIEQQMIASKLIDSLDLDIDTMERGRELNNKIKQAKIKNNESDLNDIKNLIGYESIVPQFDNNINKNQQIKPKIPQKAKEQKSNQNKEKKQVNQQQIFNNLKHKKQAKILEWANVQSQQADDLFSNCSSKKNSIITKPLNSENKGSKKHLEPIPQKIKTVSNKSVEKQKNKKSIQKERKPNVSEQLIPNFVKKPPNIVNKSQGSIQKNSNDSRKKIQSAQLQKRTEKRVSRINQSNQNQNRNRSSSKDRPKQSQQNAFQKQKQRSLQKLKERKYTGEIRSGNSAQKPKKSVDHKEQKQRIPKTQQPFRMNKNPPMPAIPKPTYTVATHEQDFNVEQFIENDLFELNEEERKLQQEIRNIHMNNKQKVKQVYSKYQIRTDYKNSANLIKHHQRDPSYGQVSEVNLTGGGYTAQHYQNQNEDLIEDSVQRLDDLLIKRQINSRQKTETQGESHAKSIINPFSKPQDLHKQILQLAENISKFQNQPNEDVKGYGYQRKMKKKQGSKQEIPEEILSESKNIEDVKKPIEKKQIRMPQPPLLQYSGKNNQIIEVNLQQKYFDPAEDSLDTNQKARIKVNQKLRNILFD